MAEISNRANGALWPRSADESAEVHEGRVVQADIPLRQEFTRPLPQCFAAVARINWNLDVEQACQQARDVYFDDRDGLIEGEAGNGVGGVTAHSR